MDIIQYNSRYPMEILRIYEENNFEVMEEDFRCKIIPNLINESQAHFQMEELVNDRRNIIGNKTADQIFSFTDNVGNCYSLENWLIPVLMSCVTFPCFLPPAY